MLCKSENNNHRQRGENDDGPQKKVNVILLYNIIKCTCYTFIEVIQSKYGQNANVKIGQQCYPYKIVPLSCRRRQQSNPHHENGKVYTALNINRMLEHILQLTYRRLQFLLV